MNHALHALAAPSRPSRAPSAAAPGHCRRALALGLAVAAALAMGGCANVAKVSGKAELGGRVALQLDSDWNQVNLPNAGRALLWTQDGLPLDVLAFWVGVKDGELLVETPKDKRPIQFKATMQPHEIVALFESLRSRDGSSFKLVKLAPADFLGGKGIRFDYEVLRRSDDVRTAGVTWAVVQNGELFAMSFDAPRLGFFPRHLPKVEQVAAAARLKA